MRLTLAVELQEKERHHANQIKKIMEELHPNVETRFITDKNALSERILEAMSKKKYDQILVEVEERLKNPCIAADCLDTLCSVVFFSTQRIAEGHSSNRFIAVITRLPTEQKERVKVELVKRAMSVLSTPRRLDCSRLPLLSYAETLAMMVKADLLPIRNFAAAIAQMIRLETTRTAGMTCLGKLVEVAFDLVRSCDAQTIGALRTALTFAQQGDTFLYDVEYIMDAFGWSLGKSPLSLCRSGAHHKSPIMAMAYCAGAGSGREVVLTSSVDGCIGTWDGSGNLLENIVLSRHYASSLDITNRGHTLVVGTVGRLHSTPPAVISYSNEMVVDSKWAEGLAVEPTGAIFITAVRCIRSSSLRFCVGTHTGTHNPLQLYDHQIMINEYNDHSDILTAIHVPPENEHTVITGSRDSTIVLYDLRIRQSTSTYNQHRNTVTAICTCGDYLVTAGLDKRVVIQDFRMGGTVVSQEMDSAVLALSVNGAMECAVSTLTGIHILSSASSSLSSAMLPCARVDSGPAAPRYNALQWNGSGTLLYAGGDSHFLDVYTARYDGDYDDIHGMLS